MTRYVVALIVVVATLVGVSYLQTWVWGHYIQDFFPGAVKQGLIAKEISAKTFMGLGAIFIGLILVARFITDGVTHFFPDVDDYAQEL